MLQDLLFEKLLKEQSFLLSEIRYKKAVIDSHLPKKIQIEKIPEIDTVFDDISVKHKPTDYEHFLWKQIAKLTHPDHNKNAETVFQLAHSAYTKGDSFELFKIAKDLNLAVQIDEPVIETIKTSVKELNLENQMLDQHLIWQWYNADGERKETLSSRINFIYEFKN